LRVISSGGKISTIPLNSSLPSGEKIYLFLKYLIPLERNSPPPEVPKLSLVVFLSPGKNNLPPKLFRISSRLREKGYRTLSILSEEE